MPLLTSTPLEAVGRRLLEPSVPVFMLHRLPRTGTDTRDMAMQHLQGCLRYLKQRKYRFLSLENLIEHLQQRIPLPGKSVVFTMDDGYYDQADFIAPIFIQHNCPLTIFIITGMLDQHNWPWDAKVAWLFDSAPVDRLLQSQCLAELGVTSCNNRATLRRNVQEAMKHRSASEIPLLIQQLASDTGIELPDEIPRDYRAMNWEQARKLEQQGICFAPHSVNHGILANMDEHSMQYEITESWHIISQQLNNPLKIFCYPNGRLTDFGERDIKALQRAGYRAAVTTVADHVRAIQSQNDLFRIPRLPVPDNMTEFIQYCSWLESARKASSID